MEFSGEFSHAKTFEIEKINPATEKMAGIAR
jgi:hypothetical protein